MKYLLIFIVMMAICIAPCQSFAQNTLVIYASQGNLNEIIEADTLADGSQAHDVYELVSLDMTYKFTGTVTVTEDITVRGVVDPTTNRPPCIQPAVLPDASIPETLFNLNYTGIKGRFENLYLLAVATNNTAGGGGVAFNVTAENIRLTVDNCVFDGWQSMGIIYNAHWCDFFVTNSHFRNMVHPNQYYIGEVIRNAWPNTAYTDTMSFVGNTMFCINGYAAAPVMVAYTSYFEFSQNKVLYTFKNPLHFFNSTDAKINDNVFYSTYVAGVDQAENPWWDNLWSPDTSYGVIHMDDLSLDNAKMFCPDDSTDPNILSIAESRRTIEVKNNTYFWPTEVTDFWDDWNSTETNWIYTPSWMSDRAVDMFSDDATWPGLVASGNVNADPGYMTTLDPDILNGGGVISNDIGILEYFRQIRGGTAATDVWGYGMTQVSGAADWIPDWPLPEESQLPVEPEENVLEIYASQGNLNEIIEADTLADGSQAHDVYELVSLDMTYKFTGTVTVTEDITVRGVVDPTTNRPPCIQPAVLPDASIPETLFNLNYTGIKGRFENLYLLAVATNNTAGGGGVAFNVTAENIRLTVDNCVFDGWQSMGIIYNAHWCDFFVTNSHFRNMVHPNQYYIGEVIRNAWPNTAYTDTMSFVGNTMFCINGYAAAPVMVAYTSYFEFSQNKVLYTFKNPLHFFNSTDAKINDNVFYSTYVAGVDQAENPWWDNLWSPDTSYGVIHMDDLSLDNAKMFCPDDSTDPNILSIAESRRTIEVKNNTYFWPTEVTDFWDDWNSTETNWIYTPSWMSDRAVDMFSDDATWPGLVASGNVNADPGYMTTLDPDILNGGGVISNDIGILEYFRQIRGGTAATDVWGYGMTQVSGADGWTPDWPLPEESHLTGIIDQDPTSLVPLEFALNNIYPNPFNPSSTVQYTLNKSGVTNLKVYNVLGQNVMTLVDNQYQTANTYKMSIDMSKFTSGMYFCVLKQGNNISVKKMMLLK